MAISPPESKRRRLSNALLSKFIMFLLQLTFILILVSLYAHGQQCKFRSRSEYGYALLGNVYNSFIAARLAVCYSACNTQPDCQSLNYNLADNTCHLNKETKASSPENFARKESFVYAENPDRGMLFGYGIFYYLQHSLFVYV